MTVQATRRTEGSAPQGAGADERTRRRAVPVLAALLLGGDVVAFLAVSAVIGLPTGLHVLVPLLGVAGWRLAGLYRFRCSLSVLDDLPRLLGPLLTAMGVTTIAGWLLGSASAERAAVAFAVLSGVAVPAVRVLTYAVARRLRTRGVLVQRAVVVGDGLVGGRLAHDLGTHPEYGLRVVGLDVGAITGDVDALVVAGGAGPGHDLVELVRSGHELGLDVYLVPSLHGLLHAGVVDDRVWRVPLVRLGRPAYERPSWRAKRMLDVVLASVALVVLAPLLGVIALLVRIGIGRPVIFRQQRIGRGGCPFMMFKFRSLHPADEAESQTRWTIANDERLGIVGRIIRATSLDELPQLINILRGEMSIVGPRPERPLFAQRFTKQIHGYGDRHRVPVGLTGWAAVHGLRGDTSVEERADLDNFYIENWSLWMDAKVVLRTVPALIRHAEPGPAQASSAHQPVGTR